MLQTPLTEDTDLQQARTITPLHLLNRGKAHLITFQDDLLAIQAKSGAILHTINAEHIQELRLRKFPIVTTITVLTKDKQTIAIGGLQRSTSEAFYEHLHTRVDELLNDETARRAIDLSPQLIGLRELITSQLAPDRFTRRSHADRMRESTEQLTAQLEQRTRQKLASRAIEALDWLESTTSSEALEQIRKTLNESHLQRSIEQVRLATADLLTNELTEQQARAIATDEDATLILAGAGTGKTAVVTGKIAHLIRNQGIDPERILALAYNRKAALEIRERLPEDLKSAHVSTFHSFALRVVASQGAAPTISKLAQDTFAYSKAIDNALYQMMAHCKYAKLIRQMVSEFNVEYREPFDFDTKERYEEYIQNAELRTLNGELVKSFEELTVANFLATNGIHYTYERPYQFLTATQQHRQYQPDFHITDHDIYIEHFALNEAGKPPPGWTSYAGETQWKRELHTTHATKLIETYSWQHRKEVLTSTLTDNLQAHGVQLNPIPEQELIHKLSKERISTLSSLLGTFLNHAKSSNLDHPELLIRTTGQKDTKRAACFLKIFEVVRQKYEEILDTENAADFHDLINRATAILTAGEWENPFDHILIDEFQDISIGRMRLTQALNKPGLAYFMVGDDWQSIYRFAGSHVGLIHQLEEYLGHTDRQTLTKTFRFGNRILIPSSGFIKQNPEQTKRNLEPCTQADDLGITVIPSDLPETGLHQALKEIEETRDQTKESILILGRYRSSLNALGPAPATIRNLELNTVHTTKGKQADYVVVLDLKDHRYGFPCKVEDDPLLTIVMPPTHGDPYPYAEERRLFYVALTRAKKAVYLITDPLRPSSFVREIIRNCPEVRVAEGMKPPCPECGKGRLTPSHSGDNLRCSAYPRCQHLSPRCPNCRKGYISLEGDSPECSNPACGSPPHICPSCRKGILVVRSGHSQFWACTKYQGTQPCTYTRPVQEAQRSTHSTRPTRLTGRRRRPSRR